MLFLMCAMVACADPVTFDEAKAKIKSQNEKLHRVVATQNTELLKEVYADDANFLAPGLGIVQGRDSIIALWKDGLDNILEMRSETIDIGGTTDVVYEVGIVENKIRSADSVFVYRAKYNNVWIRDTQGEYRLVVDIWNKLN